MHRQQRVKYEVFLRVRQFAKTYDHQIPADSPARQAFSAVAAAAAEIESHATTKALTVTESRRNKATLRAAIRERLKGVARTARLVAQTGPGVDATFKVPAQRSDVALLTAARAFIRQGDTAIERFTALGMPKKFITDLPGLVKSFEEASDGQRTGKAGNAAATAGIKTALAQGQLALRTLDVVIVNTFVDNPMVLAAWKQARQSASKVKDTAVTEPATQGKPAADGPAATAVPAETPAVPIALVPDALKKVS